MNTSLNFLLEQYNLSCVPEVRQGGSLFNLSREGEAQAWGLYMEYTASSSSRGILPPCQRAPAPVQGPFRVG